MSEQSEALRLADALDEYATGDKFQRPTEEAAAELRRLHEETQTLKRCLYQAQEAAKEMTALNQELLEALNKIATVNAMDYEYQAWARAAIAKAEGETK